MKQTIIQVLERLIMLKNKNNPQKAGVIYKLPQNTLVSILDFLTSFSDSYIHSSLPSLLISFHHLNPTRNLPDIFLTYQKSNAFSTTIKTNESELPIHFDSSKYLIINITNLHNNRKKFEYNCKKYYNWMLSK